MNKSTGKNIALILLLSITALSMVKYVSELKARYRLQDSLAQSQGEVVVLTQEKQNLLQELEKEKVLKEQLAQNNANLKDNLRASKAKIIRLFQDNSKVQARLQDANAMFSILKAENKALMDSRKRIAIENEEFKIKLSSVDELKKVIKQLKADKRRASVLEIEGNKGYLIKNGQPTAREKIKIEVIPAKIRE